MQVVYTDSGVEYTANGKTLSFSGEQEAGEVHLGNTLMGFYERDEDDNVCITDPSGKIVGEFGSSEDEYEEFATSVLV